MKISYAITVCSELEEIKILLPHLLENKRDQDEIVILFDETNGTSEVFDFINSHPCEVFSGEFDGHFGNWKNKLTSHCFGDYIFQIDADEEPNKHLISSLPTLLESNPTLDILLVPRENYVIGITPEHINKWGWKLDNNLRINWPDYQWRIYRNTYKIQWVNKVHEKLEGYDTYTHLPQQTEYSILHSKNIEKQEKQNNYYDTL